MLIVQLSNEDSDTHRDQDLQKPSSGRIHQKAFDDELRAGKQRCRTQKKRRARNIAGDLRLDSMQRLVSLDSNGVAGLLDYRPECAERQLAVITCAYKFNHSRRSRRKQTSEQQT